MRILPNAMASSFIYARLCPVDMSWSEHFAATLFQYLKDVNRIPRWQRLIVDDHFLVESNWEDEVLKQTDVKGIRGQTDHKQVVSTRICHARGCAYNGAFGHTWEFIAPHETALERTHTFAMWICMF